MIQQSKYTKWVLLGCLLLAGVVVMITVPELALAGDMPSSGIVASFQ